MAAGQLGPRLGTRQQPAGEQDRIRLRGSRLPTLPRRLQEAALHQNCAGILFHMPSRATKLTWASCWEGSALDSGAASRLARILARHEESVWHYAAQ